MEKYIFGISNSFQASGHLLTEPLSFNIKNAIFNSKHPTKKNRPDNFVKSRVALSSGKKLFKNFPKMYLTG